MSRQSFLHMKNTDKTELQEPECSPTLCVQLYTQHRRHSRKGLYWCDLTNKFLLNLVCNISRNNKLDILPVGMDLTQKDSYIFRKSRLFLSFYTICAH